MGNVLKWAKEMAAKNKAMTGGPTGGGNNPTPAGPKAPHSADWLLAKHRADQGLGEQPADPNSPNAPAAPTGGSPAPVTAPSGGGGGGSGEASTGGIAETALARKRRLATGIQL